MSFFDLILIQPIFNILMVIYGLVPGRDFGVAVIIFTIIVRLAMWPLIKKQLHQSKVMREIQPELVKIKQRAKGNKQLEATLMMELYKEKGVNPFSSIGTLVLQLPIFIALFAVVRMVTEGGTNIAKYTYDFFEQIPAVADSIGSHVNTTLFGLVDLTKIASSNEGIYWPLMVLAVAAGVLQFYQSKQLLPQTNSKRKLRELLKEQAAGKEVDQAEISALMTGKMVWLFPIMTFMISTYLSGALVVYFVTTSIVAIIQQARVLNRDEKDLEKLSTQTKTKVKKAKEAEVISGKGGAKKSSKNKRS